MILVALQHQVGAIAVLGRLIPTSADRAQLNKVA